MFLLAEGGLLEGVGVSHFCRRRQDVPLHVEFGGREQLCEDVALVESVGLLDLCGEFGRHRCAGLVVLRVVSEDAGVGGPVLVELRGELDEVARHGGTADQRVFDVREHAVERVTELVEHGAYVVE